MMIDRLEKTLSKYIGVTSMGSFVYNPREIAKEILRELLKPTDEMIKAGYEATDKWWDIKGGPLKVKAEKMKIRWRAMIKEALKNEPTS